MRYEDTEPLRWNWRQCYGIPLDIQLDNGDDEMTTTNTPFEEGLDEIFTRHNLNGIGQGGLTSAEAKAALTQLHKAAIVAELEAIRNVKGETVDAWASPAYQMLLDRIEQYKKEGR